MRLGQLAAKRVRYRHREEFGAVCLGWVGHFELNDKLIAVAHGHMRYDVRHALASRPHYLLSGHSHVASDRYDGLVRRINPGAIYEADQFTVALLDLQNDELRFLTLPPPDKLATVDE